MELTEGHVFQGWHEGAIEFPPTYKYRLYSNDYLACDQQHGMKQIQYNRSESRLSDHRPVRAMFTADIREKKIKEPNCGTGRNKALNYFSTTKEPIITRPHFLIGEYLPAKRNMILFRNSTREPASSKEWNLAARQEPRGQINGFIYPFTLAKSINQDGITPNIRRQTPLNHLVK
ncbi:Type IV inositol polyphosphate 5-phosphatase 9, partial [Mucuna pruriens]